MTDEQVRIDLLRDYIASALRYAEDIAGGMGAAKAAALHVARCVAADVEATSRVLAPVGEPVQLRHGEMVLDPKGSDEIRAMLKRQREEAGGDPE